jgi:hypothetical protein
MASDEKLQYCKDKEEGGMTFDGTTFCKAFESQVLFKENHSRSSLMVVSAPGKEDSANPKLFFVKWFTRLVLLLWFWVNAFLNGSLWLVWGLQAFVAILTPSLQQLQAVFLVYFISFALWYGTVV